MLAALGKGQEPLWGRDMKLIKVPISGGAVASVSLPPPAGAAALSSPQTEAGAAEKQTGGRKNIPKGRGKGFGFFSIIPASDAASNILRECHPGARDSAGAAGDLQLLVWSWGGSGGSGGAVLGGKDPPDPTNPKKSYAQPSAVLPMLGLTPAGAA